VYNVVRPFDPGRMHLNRSSHDWPLESCGIGSMLCRIALQDGSHDPERIVPRCAATEVSDTVMNTSQASRERRQDLMYWRNGRKGIGAYAET